MTDLELLELAAKAAGIAYIKPADGYDGSLGLEAGSNPMRTHSWDPLRDDGDALRLAVKLRRNVWHSKWPSGNSYAAAQTLWHSNDSLYYDDGVAHGTDPYAATRRAIVQAAAEVGKRMK